MNARDPGSNTDSRSVAPNLNLAIQSRLKGMAVGHPITLGCQSRWTVGDGWWVACVRLVRLDGDGTGMNSRSDMTRREMPFPLVKFECGHLGYGLILISISRWVCELSIEDSRLPFRYRCHRAQARPVPSSNTAPNEQTLPIAWSNDRSLLLHLRCTMTLRS